MIRKRGAGSGPFLMEMLAVVGFFMICATICATVFARADRISRQAWDMNYAVGKAQSLAEELKAGFTAAGLAAGLEAGQKLQWSEMLPDRDIWRYVPPYPDDRSREQDDWLRELKKGGGYEGMYTMYWDNDWQEEEPSSSPPYLGVIFLGTVDGIKRVDISIMRYKNAGNKGEVLYRLQTEIYAAPKELSVNSKDGKGEVGGIEKQK